MLHNNEMGGGGGGGMIYSHDALLSTNLRRAVVCVAFVVVLIAICNLLGRKWNMGSDVY
jgi:hypothetical protein